ncbi:MAG: hypothetical protein KA803_05960 [Rhodoferax sp.]|nr:hypothetical protein [Rhodoferax sp.]
MLNALPGNWLSRLSVQMLITGAVLPSSARLANEMAQLALGSEHVLELGAGGGAVTTALVKAIGSDRIHAVELQERQAHQLKTRFPEIRVSQGTAAAALDTCQQQGVIAVVSSLPFRSLPTSIKQSTITSLLRYLGSRKDARLIQFTYGLREPFDAGAEFRWTRVGWVFANLPPASVWLLTSI